jgi:hypothetical protein
MLETLRRGWSRMLSFDDILGQGEVHSMPDLREFSVYDFVCTCFIANSFRLSFS